MPYDITTRVETLHVSTWTSYSNTQTIELYHKVFVEVYPNRPPQSSNNTCFHVCIGCLFIIYFGVTILFILISP